MTVSAIQGSNIAEVTVPKSESIEELKISVNVLAKEVQEWDTLEWNPVVKRLSAYRPGFWFRVNGWFDPKCLEELFFNVQFALTQSSISSESAHRETIEKNIQEVKIALPTALKALTGVAKAYEYYNYSDTAKKIISIQEKWQEILVPRNRDLEMALAASPANAKRAKSWKARPKPQVVRVKRPGTPFVTVWDLKRNLRPVDERTLPPRPETPPTILERQMKIIRPFIKLEKVDEEPEFEIEV